MSKRRRDTELIVCPGGATDVEQLFAFPLDVIKSLCCGPGGAERAGRLQRNFRLGFRISEDYAGMGSAGMCLVQGAHAVAELGMIPADFKAIHLHRACDKEMLCLRVLGLDKSLILDPDERPQHLHCDLWNRLRDQDKIHLDLLMPSDSMTTKEKDTCYSNMQAYLRQAGKEIFSGDSAGHCLVHGCRCKFLPDRDMQLNGLKNEPVGETQRPWITNHAGHTCVAWSSRGKQEGQGHMQSALPFAIWSTERIFAKEDIIIGECVGLSEIKPLFKAPSFQQVNLHMCVSNATTALQLTLKLNFKEREHMRHTSCAKLPHANPWSQLTKSHCEKLPVAPRCGQVPARHPGTGHPWHEAHHHLCWSRTSRLARSQTKGMEHPAEPGVRHLAGRQQATAGIRCLLQEDLLGRR